MRFMRRIHKSTKSLPVPQTTKMSLPETISDYLRLFATELGDRILHQYPALYPINEALSPRFGSLLRRPFPAQQAAIMGVVKRWDKARAAAVVAECGTGKTLISLASMHVHSQGRAFNSLVMVPPQLVEKWAREAILTLPRVRVFLIDGLRDPSNAKVPHGVNEVKLKQGRIIREGLGTGLTDLRLRREGVSPRARWKTQCSWPSVFVIGRDRAKLGYFWRHAYQFRETGHRHGIVINPDTGQPIYEGEDQLLVSDFGKVRRSEVIGNGNDTDAAAKCRRPLFSPLWQADENKIRRFSPIEFIGRYLAGFFDYAIADEVHELKGDTAQGNALATLAGCANRIAVLTGTLLGGYADDVFNILFRLEPAGMVSHGFEWGEAGVRRFMESYGALEKVTIIRPEENACSKAKVTKEVKRRPGASPLLFGQFLMSLGAFVSLEDISHELPPYEEEVIGVPMDGELAEAYTKLETDIKLALKEHRGNRSVLSIALNSLLLYPDRPFELGDLNGFDYDPVTHRRELFLIAHTRDLDQAQLQAKERRLLEEVQRELAQGRCCQIYAVYTQKRDVTNRLQSILLREGTQTAVLTSHVPPDQREAWYDRQMRSGVQVVICHPKLVQTGLDLLQFPTLIFYETGYSIYVLRQASRRSWRIGQREPVKVKFLYYQDTLQGNCLRLMGKKLLVSMAMEGKFAAEGLQGIDEGDDLLMALARELIEERNIGECADAVWRDLRLQQESMLDRQDRCGPSKEKASQFPSPKELDEITLNPAAETFEAWSHLTQLGLFGLSQAVKKKSRIRGAIKRNVPHRVSQQESLF